MVLAHVSLLLQWSRPRILGVAVINGSRGNWTTTVGRSNTSRKRQFVEGHSLYCSSSASSSDACEDVRVDGLPSLREYMATLGVFFTLPEQGVTSPEILTRCEFRIDGRYCQKWGRLSRACLVLLLKMQLRSTRAPTTTYGWLHTQAALSQRYISLLRTVFFFIASAYRAHTCCPPQHKSRCSATPVRLTPSSPLRFIAAAHAVMPWAFPGYHDESHAWLKFLDDSNVRHYVELRDVRICC